MLGTFRIDHLCHLFPQHFPQRRIQVRSLAVTHVIVFFVLIRIVKGGRKHSWKPIQASQLEGEEQQIQLIHSSICHLSREVRMKLTKCCLESRDTLLWTGSHMLVVCFPALELVYLILILNSRHMFLFAHIREMGPFSGDPTINSEPTITINKKTSTRGKASSVHISSSIKPPPWEVGCKTCHFGAQRDILASEAPESWTTTTTQQKHHRLLGDIP